MNEKRYVHVYIDAHKQKELVLKLEELSKKENRSKTYICLNILCNHFGVELRTKEKAVVNIKKPLKDKPQNKYQEESYGLNENSFRY